MKAKANIGSINLVKTNPSEVSPVATRTRRVGRPKKGLPSKKASAKDREEFRETIVYMRGSPEYFDFVDTVHRKTGINKVQMFRFGFALWCEKHGHGTPPEI